MPEGHYAVHAVQFAEFGYLFIPREELPTDRVREWRRITNQVHRGTYSGVHVRWRPYPPPTWPDPEPGGIYNLQYTILAVDRKHVRMDPHNPGRILRTRYLGYTYPSLNGDSFTAGRKYYRPRIPEYFMAKYPDSGWAPYLEKLLLPPRGN